MNKKILIRVTIIFALITQVSHASELFYLLSGKNMFSEIMSWDDTEDLQKFTGMLLISPIIPLTIYFYSELIENENKPKMGRPRKDVT